MIKKKCKNCGKTFIAERENRKYCCDKCMWEAIKREKRERYYLEKWGKLKSLEEVTCPICGKKFKQKRTVQKYCSEECRNKARNSYESRRAREAAKKKNKKDPHSLDKKAKEASASGMSYGMWQAMRNAEITKVRI